MLNFSISRKAASFREVPREQKRKNECFGSDGSEKKWNSPDGIDHSKKRNVEESVKVYKEALQLYKDKIKPKTLPILQELIKMLLRL